MSAPAGDLPCDAVGWRHRRDREQCSQRGVTVSAKHVLCGLLVTVGRASGERTPR